MKRPLVLWLCCCSVLTLVGAKAYGLAESTGPGGSNAQAVHDLGQIGDGVKIGLIASRNVYTNHEAFFDKDPCGAPTGPPHANNLDYTGDGNSPWIHDTWMAGIATSRGSTSHPNDIGVAPGADVYCARVINDACGLSQSWLDGTFTDPNGALDELIGTYGCRVIMTGIAFTSTPDGQSGSTLMYDYYADTYDVVFTPGAGNGDDEIWVFGDMYNGIVTGGLTTDTRQVWDRVGSSSGSGPTEDGRRKPDVVAPAQKQYMPHTLPDNWKYWNEPPEGATSLSGPHTAGIAALLLGLADSTAEPNDGHSEVIRAVIVNSAFPNIKDKQGQSTNPLDPNNVWQEDRGYGRVDALRAYQLLQAGQVQQGTTATGSKGWGFGNLGSGGLHEYTIQGGKNHRLVLTVTWNRVPTREWSSSQNRYVYYDEDSPKFNIAITIEDQNGIPIPLNDDTINNTKKREMLLPADGDYTIKLTNTTSKNREYALAFELIEPLVADFNIDYIVDINDPSVLAEDWLQSNTRADATGEGDVNFRDFAVFAANRGSFNPLYY